MSLIYALTTLVALYITVKIWGYRISKDQDLIIIYISALFGALLGAHLGYFTAEGYLHTELGWMQQFGGKTIIGALIGGFISVELIKRCIGYKAITGDLFAVTIPIAIAVGRVGCLSAECCLGQPSPLSWYSLIDSQGISRWPAVPVEIIFNLTIAAFFFLLRRRHLLNGQHFHLYMICYGSFRFLHEGMRLSPKFGNAINGYQLLCLILVLTGAYAANRRRSQHLTQIEQHSQLKGIGEYKGVG